MPKRRTVRRSSRPASRIGREHRGSTCWLHVGTHKTGSTSIQAFLAANSTRLRDEGIHVPRFASNGDPQFTDHALFAHALVDEDDERYERWLPAIVPAGDADVCLSSEDFSHLHHRPERLTQLRDALAGRGYRARIILYVRPQASYAAAIYAANVRSGYRGSLDEFLCDLVRFGRYRWNRTLGPPFEYDLLASSFASVFGTDAVDVRRFSSEAGDRVLLADFLSALGVDGEQPGWTYAAQRANRTLTFAQVLELLSIDASIPDDVRFAPFTLADLAALCGRFSHANRRLYAAFGCRLPVCEPIDILRSLPIRRSLRRMRDVQRARSALRGYRSPPSTTERAMDRA